jgi:serine/threonine protein kinase
MTEPSIWRAVLQTAEGLRYIHSQHILHRDIKPLNVFLTAAGDVKLGDFGVSKLLESTMELGALQCPCQMCRWLRV